MGTLRSWVIRGGILALVLAVAGGAWVVGEYVSPDRVRALLEAHLREKVPGADVSVGAASLRLFGGITATDVRITRKGESEPFFSAPRMVLAHDKEQLHRGKLVLRKVELDGAVLRVERRADGAWSLSDVFAPAPESAGAVIPTVIIKNATVHVTDRSPDPLPPLVLARAKFTLLNDPATVVRVDGAFTLAPSLPGGQQAPAGLTVPMTVSVRANRQDRALQVRVEVPDLLFGPDVAPAVAKFAPDLAEHLEAFTARIGVRADVRRDAAGGPAKYDVKVDVRDGQYASPALPWPLDHVAGTVHYKDGRVAVEKGSARFGKATVELALESRPLADAKAGVAAAGGDTNKALDAALDRLSVQVRELPLDDELFAKLPARAHRTRQMLSPAGTVDVTVSLTRGPAGLRREYDIAPNKLSIAYEKFRYPVHDLRGSVKRVTTPDGLDEYVVGVDGSASGRPVKLVGRVGAQGDDPLIDLKLTGHDFPIDARLVAALPPAYAAGLAALRPTGLADFAVVIRQPDGVDRCESAFNIRVHGGAVNPERFPYPLADVAGTVNIRVAATGDRARQFGPQVDTDRVDLRDFRAAHAGGRVRFSASDEPVPNSPDRRRVADVACEDLPIDADFQKAVASLGGADAWAALNPRGTLNFAAHVEAAHRAIPPVTPVGVLTRDPSRVAPAATAQAAPPFDPTQDLAVAVGFRGPSVTPRDFPYELTDLAGAAKYSGGKLEMSDLKARHGRTEFAVGFAEVRFAPGGGVWANLGQSTAKPFPLSDPDLLAALPEAARTAVADLKLSGPVDLLLKHLVVSVPGAGAAAGVSLYWKAEARLAGASFDAGAPCKDVHGAVASEGQLDGGRVGPVHGNAWFDRLTVSGQPLTAVKVGYQVEPARPDGSGGVAPTAVRFSDVAANLFGGSVGGQARVEFPGGPPRFKLWLTASGVKVDELAAHWHPGSGAAVSGVAQGKVLLENPPDARTGVPTFAGAGQIDIPTGRLLNLPVLLPLLKLLKLQTPDQTAFEEAHAAFEVRGDRVHVTQLDLVGSAVSLGGSGELDTKGDDVRFEFYTVWSQALRRWLQTPLGDVTSALSGNLFRIEMSKSPGRAMEYKPQMLPVVTDPVKAVAERLRNRLGARTPDAAGPTYRAAPSR